MRKLVLTSTSPRRKKILKDFGYEFRTFPIEVSEILKENLNLPDKISDCAKQKVMAAVESGKFLESLDEVLLGADTVVVHQGQILGKPKNEQEAITILSQLSGDNHQVITGFCLFDLSTQRLILSHDTTTVRFKSLSQNDITQYVATGDPMDKAGAYGIQGEAGAFVDHFEGSLYNVIGLPIEKIERIFKENNWLVKRKSQLCE